MKNIIVSAAITSLFSLSAVAADPTPGTVDSTSATIEWTADIPVVVPGQYITLTGADRGPVKSGVLDIKADGTFTSTPVALEVRYYDEESDTVGGGVLVGENTADGASNADSITYSVNSVAFTSAQNIDLSATTAQIFMNDVAVDSNKDLEAPSTESWKTNWKIQNGVGSSIQDVVAGDTVTATTVVFAEVSFVDPAV
ncbi:hypothetical protein Sps_02883 [Shewanella psychrophila]|uniref:Uncharacterized protein n=1 Tax=Shewanella psychrophila TaxID=225848 RepID=A0A1S6HRB0_9GAMM|nr:hypothetical protein [Shewanella psychrophila]AQS38031.1 hypothetical protein Sps_02883 [Shewanella psychrophila]